MMRFAVAMVLVACAKTDATSPTSSKPVASASATSNARFDCKVDADCVLSCSRGAVNNAWYLAGPAKSETCEDGCSSKGMSARCVNAQCAAFDVKGQPVPDCTKKP